MKKIILIILAFISISSIESQAQYQTIFGQNSTQWVFEWHNLSIDEQDTLFVQKDTFAFGENWKKLVIGGFYGNFPGALLREDTTIGKVWYKALYPNPPYSNLQLLFDFSLIKGDTFDVSNMWSGGPNATTIVENTVDTVYYKNGLKYIQFLGQYYPGVPPENYTFIEGIGGNLGILWKQYSGLRQVNYLLCSYKDGVQTNYVNKRYNGDCDVFGGTNNISSVEKLKETFIIYPNPSSSKLLIDNDKFNSEIKSISLINTLGQRINNFPVMSKEIDLINLSNGIYTLEIITKENIKIYRNFIKN